MKSPDESMSLPSSNTARLAALIAFLTILCWAGFPRVAAAQEGQDLLSTLAQVGIQIGYGYLNPQPRCYPGEHEMGTIIYAPRPQARPQPRYQPPARNVNIDVYPPPAPRRSVNVDVWPEPPARPVVAARQPIRNGTDTTSGYVMRGSVPAQQPQAPVREAAAPAPYRDISPSQERLRGH